MYAFTLSLFSLVQLFATVWTVALQAPLSMGFSRKEAIPFSRASSQPGDRIHISCVLHWQVGSLPLVPPGKPIMYNVYKVLTELLTECRQLINGSDVRTAPPPGIPPEWPHSFSHPDHPDPNPSLKRPAGAAFTSRETLLIKNKTKKKKKNKELDQYRKGESWGKQAAMLLHAYSPCRAQHRA